MTQTRFCFRKRFCGKILQVVQKKPFRKPHDDTSWNWKSLTAYNFHMNELETNFFPPVDRQLEFINENIIIFKIGPVSCFLDIQYFFQGCRLLTWGTRSWSRGPGAPGTRPRRSRRTSSTARPAGGFTASKLMEHWSTLKKTLCIYMYMFFFFFFFLRLT